MDTEKNNPYKGGEHIEKKKSAGANIEKRKVAGLLIGFIFVFALLYVALEYTTFEHKKAQQAIENNAPVIQDSTPKMFRIYKPPVQQQPQEKKTTEIDKKIKILDETSEEEESDLIAPEDMGAEDFVEVEYTGDIQVEEEVEEEEIFVAVQQQASFPGGLQKMYDFVRDNLKYPAVSRNNNSQGTTHLRFVVRKDGRIDQVTILKSSGDAFLDQEAVRVVSLMPSWTPAQQNGRSVSSWFTLPIKFTLQ